LKASTLGAVASSESSRGVAFLEGYRPAAGHAACGPSVCMHVFPSDLFFHALMSPFKGSKLANVRDTGYMLLSPQKHMDMECRTPECRLECKAYNNLMPLVAVLAVIFALESPVTAELYKRLTYVGGLWLEVIKFMWLTAWALLAILLIKNWSRIRRCR
jgi:hypothetical protein